MTRADRVYWGLAWLCLALAIPLRLTFFAGFGLGDDPNESLALINFAHTLRLDPANFMHYRVVNVVIRGVLYRLFGGHELAFILPVLAFALGTHAVTMTFARDILGARAAFLTSLLFLTTPYETLASTANIPDYFHAFFGATAGWMAYRGLRANRPAPMIVAAACVVLAFLNRLSAILLIPPFGVATLVTLRRWRSWTVFWGAFVAFIGLVCVWDRFHSGDPFRWIFFNAGGLGGYDVTNMLGYVLMVYPRYLFGRDDLQNFMFGVTGWCAALGAVVALWRALRGRAGAGEAVVLIAFFVFGGMFEFLPHKITFHSYWSHPRIFRYVAQISAVVYLCGAYLLDRLWDVPRRLPVHVGPLLCAGVVAFSLYETPRVAGPLVDADRDSRWLVAYLKEHAGPQRVAVYTDSWRIALVVSRYDGFHTAWDMHGVGADSKTDKENFLRTAPAGSLVVTGGATLPWYSGIDLVLSLSRIEFTVPATWTLLAEYPGKTTPWRAEPMRVWSVGRPVADGVAGPPTS